MLMLQVGTAHTLKTLLQTPKTATRHQHTESEGTFYAHMRVLWQTQCTPMVTVEARRMCCRRERVMEPENQACPRCQCTRARP